MSALGWMLSKIGKHDNARVDAMVDVIAREHRVSPWRVKLDMYLNAVIHGAGFTDYFRGDYFGASAEHKRTFVTTRSFYKILAYLNDEGYANVMRDKVLFDQVFHSYLGREFINLRTADFDAFCAFVEGKDVVFAKKPAGFGGHGVSKVELAGKTVNELGAVYQGLIERDQILVEEEIVQAAEVNEINPKCVASFRVITLVKDGKAHLIGNSLRVNQNEGDVIGCAGDLYFGLEGDGHLSTHAVDDYGTIYEEHPLTGKRFEDVEISGVDKAFDICLRAALEVPQVRYVGWDIAFSENGPVLMEGNAYPGYGLVQFCKMNGRQTGHLKEIADVLGDEMADIRI